MSGTDDEYLQIVLDAIRVSAHYRPKFGQGVKGEGLTLELFRDLYQRDAFGMSSGTIWRHSLSETVQRFAGR